VLLAAQVAVAALGSLASLLQPLRAPKAQIGPHQCISRGLARPPRSERTLFKSISETQSGEAFEIFTFLLHGANSSSAESASMSSSRSVFGPRSGRDDRRLVDCRNHLVTLRIGRAETRKHHRKGTHPIDAGASHTPRRSPFKTANRTANCQPIGGYTEPSYFPVWFGALPLELHDGQDCLVRRRLVSSLILTMTRVVWCRCGEPGNGPLSRNQAIFRRRHPGPDQFIGYGCARLAGAAHGRTAGVSIVIPRARCMRKSSRATSLLEPKA
jgi:hypothetical protein